MPVTEQTLWSNFYAKLSELDKYHSSLQEQGPVIDSLPPEAIFAREMELVLKESDRIFTGEESHGKFFDLNSQYVLFCNIKKLRLLGIIKADDYLTWL